MIQLSITSLSSQFKCISYISTYTIHLISRYDLTSFIFIEATDRKGILKFKKAKVYKVGFFFFFCFLFYMEYQQ